MNKPFTEQSDVFQTNSTVYSPQRTDRQPKQYNTDRQKLTNSCMKKENLRITTKIIMLFVAPCNHDWFINASIWQP